MTLILYHHPFSSYCQKALIALHEKEVPFRSHVIDLTNERARAELASMWPYGKVPVLHDMDQALTLPESTIIVDYVDSLSAKGPRLIPADPRQARNVRLLDRMIDNYLHTPLQKIVGDRLRPEGARDPHGVAEARATLAISYGLLERSLNQSGWFAGPDFTLADCAAAPTLFYLARVAPFDRHPRLFAYLKRVTERPSFRRCLEEARPHRGLFPSAPDDAAWADEDQRVAF